jgi:hypothetical protein
MICIGQTYDLASYTSVTIFRDVNVYTAQDSYLKPSHSPLLNPFPTETLTIRPIVKEIVSIEQYKLKFAYQQLRTKRSSNIIINTISRSQ